MKCSHGIQFEVKCPGCFKDAMERVSASQVRTEPLTMPSEVKTLDDPHQLAIDSIRGLS